MWNYEKRLQYPINIKNCNPTLAAMIISQYGGLRGDIRKAVSITVRINACGNRAIRRNNYV